MKFLKIPRQDKSGHQCRRDAFIRTNFKAIHINLFVIISFALLFNRHLENHLSKISMWLSTQSMRSNRTPSYESKLYYFVARSFTLFSLGRR